MTATREIIRGPVGEARRAMPRRHRWMLILAFEILVFGLAQAAFQPVRRGVSVETTVTPNHVVT